MYFVGITRSNAAVGGRRIFVTRNSFSVSLADSVRAAAAVSTANTVSSSANGAVGGAPVASTSGNASVI